MEKVIKIVSKEEASSDFAFWQKQTPLARLEALEQIRREYHAWKDNAEPGFQRVLEIVKR